MSSHSIPNSSRPDDSGFPPPRENAKDQSTPVMIAVMGATGSGKTSFINLASGSSLRVGTNLESCTDEVNTADAFPLDGRPVVLIDTPGFDDSSKSDTEVLKLIAAYLASTYEKGSKLAGVIYIHRISDYRFTGIAGRNFKMFRDLCGDKTLQNVVLVTNMWDDVTPENGEARENELSSKFWKPVLDKRAQMVRHHNTTQSAHDIIRKIIMNRPEALQIQRELVEEHKDIADTAAGVAVNHELSEQIKRHQAELKELREAMEQASGEKGEETRRKLAEQAKQLQGLIERIEKDKEEMSSRYAEEKKRMEAKITKMGAKITEIGAERDKLLEMVEQLKPIMIPIHRASDDKEIKRSEAYPRTSRVSSIKDELIEAANTGRFFDRHVYVEVVLKGNEEGKFLEDPKADHKETIENVLKLVHWTHAEIDGKVKEIAREVNDLITKAGVAKRLGVVSDVVGNVGSTLLPAFSKAATTAVSTTTSVVRGRPMYYEHLRSARNARKALGTDPKNLTVGSAKIAMSFLSNHARITRGVFSR